MHRSRTARTAILPALASCLALALAAPAAGAAEEPTVKFTHESLQAYEQQLNSGQISAVEFNKRVRSMHITLKDGRKMLTVYPAKQSAKYEAQLKAKGVPVTVLSKTVAAKEVTKKPVKHKIRYIVGGVVVALIVVGAIVLLARRRRLTRD